MIAYIREKRPELYPLYVEIYIQGSRIYWKALDEQVRAYAMQYGYFIHANCQTL